MPDITPNEELSVQPHPDPLATTQDFQEHAICEIDGKVGATQAAIFLLHPAQTRMT